MSVFVGNPEQQITDQLLKMTRISNMIKDCCGVILMKCTNANPKYLLKLQSYLQKLEPELNVECYFDDQTRVLGVFLEGQKLASTHYLSLACKDYLERYHLLAGQIIVASFPEYGDSSELNLSQLLHAATKSEGEDRSIKLFVDPSTKEGVSSILVVDSEEMNREFIKLKMELKGYEVYEAKDGSEALEKFIRYSPDLVITELNLPIVDGFQLIAKIMKEHVNDSKVIVLTDQHVTQNMNRAFELGASDYVTKPFSISELEWRIKKLQIS